MLAIEFAVWLNVSIPYFEGNTVFYISYLIISSVQLGATVDYAILFTERYCEFRSRLQKKAGCDGNCDGGDTIHPYLRNCSGCRWISVGGISSHGILAQLGMFVGFGSLLSLATVLFVLPGLLYLLDALIQRTTLKLNFVNRSKEVVSK